MELLTKLKTPSSCSALSRHGGAVGRSWAVSLRLAFVLFAGCSQMTRPEQADTGEKVDAQAFLHEHLQRLPAVTVAEACRGMIMLADGEDKFTSFEQRESSLIEREILRPEWRLEREQAIDRGSVAYMVTRILNIRGGVKDR